jgi:uncharacterized phage protein (TIGR01671 family)
MIKFRVWDAQKKKWGSTPCLIFSRQCVSEKLGTYEYVEYVGDIEDQKQGFIVQRFTGLFDSEGKEIYEGDIVEYSYPSLRWSGAGEEPKEVELKVTAPVVFSPVTVGFVMDTSGRHLFDDKYGDYITLHYGRKYVIRGNIFQKND